MSQAPFEAWALPVGVGVDPAGAHRFDVGTPPHSVLHLPVDADWVDRVADELEVARARLVERPAGEIAQVLGRVGSRFLDSGDSLRSQALALLPDTAGLSPPMAEAVLDGMAADWTGPRLTALLEAEFGEVAALDGPRPHADGATLAVGPRLCLQIVAGSVPGVSVNALIRSLLVKGPTLVKPGRGDLVLPVLFARALREEDPTLADAVGVVYWQGGLREVEDAALARADVVTSYGGDDAVGDLRRRTPITTRFVAYHHRWSVGVVGRGALLGPEVGPVAAAVAASVALFDQRGCVSPQVVFVEEGAEVDPRTFAEALAVALEELEVAFPGGPLEPAEASALQQVRGTAEMVAASGAEAALWHGGAASWTVIYDPEGSLGAGCPGRLVRVVPVGSVSDVPSRLRGLADHLQTVALAGVETGRGGLAEALGRAGASRIVPFAEVPFPPPWWHHDGGGPLRDLVRWVDVRGA